MSSSTLWSTQAHRCSCMTRGSAHRPAPPSSASPPRMTLPVLVFGTSSTNWTSRGTLYAASVPVAELDDLVLGCVGAGLQDDVGLGEFALQLVIDTADGHQGDGGMPGHHALDLSGVHVVPGGEDHVLLAIDDEHAAISVHPAEVAGVQPAIGFNRLAGLLFITQQPCITIGPRTISSPTSSGGMVAAASSTCAMRHSV